MARWIRPKRLPIISSPVIRYPVADLAGQLIWADRLGQHADRGARGVVGSCVVCKGAMRLAAVGEQGPYFVHQVASGCAADDETALRATTIRVIRDGVLAAANEHRPFPLTLRCDSCLAERVADLARAAHRATVREVLANGIRPDLLMLSATDRPLYAVEVVVAHEPQREALQLYRDRDLPCIQVRPTWETLSGIRNGFSAMHGRDERDLPGCVDVVDRCRFPRHVPEIAGTCRQCTKDALPVSVEVSLNRCWNCSRAQRVLDIYTRTGREIVLVAAGCADLVGVSEIAAARAVSVRLAYSKRAARTYLMHVCTFCRATSGDNFLYGSMESETPMPILAESVWQMVVCPDGHWEKFSERMWSPGTSVARPRPAVGLVGAAVGLFEGRRSSGFVPECPGEAGLTITAITENNVDAYIRHLMGCNQEYS